VATDGHWWRTAALGTLAIGAVGWTLKALRDLRRHELEQLTWMPKIEVVFMPGLVAVLCILTGGVRSPFLQLVLTASVLAPIGYPARAAMKLTAGIIIVIVGLALFGSHAHWMMPRAFTDGDGRLSTTYDLTIGFIWSMTALTGCLFGVSVRRMSDDMLQRSLETRDELLILHRERLQELTTLSGEIAHELKNPLASVKGLVHLIEADPPRAAERLRVLRGEVDRMQAILDEFLNFSRPLVPLAQEGVDVAELAGDVLDLHEGLAHEHDIALAAPACPSLEVRCDRRKIKQILINLVQNAIDVSPGGGAVEVTVEHKADQAAICVLDRGPGLVPELSDRVFEPGVTSKARGSGLGLTIVRMLAEQHGGSANLRNRDGGGCIAEILLPITGAPVASEAQS
jgi:two-component system, NtrC family, sensor histidine kinase HydH